MIEYLLWAPNRPTFLSVLAALTLPDGSHIAAVEGEAITPTEDVRIDEIGPVVQVPASIDDDGNELAPAVMVDGHHVNLVAVGPLAQMLTAGMPGEGDVFARSRILDLLGQMEFVPITEEGVPAGWQGTSGVRLFDPAVVDQRYRVWA